MKKLIFTAALFFTVFCAQAQIGSAIFSIDPKGNITTKSEFIDPFYEDCDLSALTYAPGNPVAVKLPSKTYTIRTCAFDEWECEADRGFNVIEITQKNRDVLTLKQGEFWTFITDDRPSFNLEEYTDNNYFIRVPLSAKSQALIFRGFMYGTGPAPLSIVVLTENQAKLVFNKEMYINSIIQISSGGFFMQLQSNICEWDDERRPYYDPITHVIWLDDGVLRFKNDQDMN